MITTTYSTQANASVLANVTKKYSSMNPIPSAKPNQIKMIKGASEDYSFSVDYNNLNIVQASQLIFNILEGKCPKKVATPVVHETSSFYGVIVKETDVAIKSVKALTIESATSFFEGKYSDYAVKVLDNVDLAKEYATEYKTAIYQYNLNVVPSSDITYDGLDKLDMKDLFAIAKERGAVIKGCTKRSTIIERIMKTIA